MPVYKFKALGNYKFSIGERLVPIKIEHGEIDTTLHLVRQKDYAKMMNITQPKVDDILTEREIDIMELVSDGLSNKEICEKLFVTLTTLKTHLNNIYQKFNVGTAKEGTNNRSEPGVLRVRIVQKYKQLTS